MTRVSVPQWVGGQAGFALPAAMSVLLIMSTLVLSISVTAKVELDIASKLAARHRAEVIADAAIQLALGKILNTPPGQARDVIASGQIHVRVGEADIGVETASESGKIDLNTASARYLGAISKILESKTSSDELAAQLIDYADRDSIERMPGSERSVERIGPKNAPFESAAEATDALGLESKSSGYLTDTFTISSGLLQPDPSRTSSALREMLALPAPSGPGVVGMVGGIGGEAVSLSAVVPIDGGGELRRSVTVRFTDNRTDPFWVLAQGNPSRCTRLAGRVVSAR